MTEEERLDLLEWLEESELFVGDPEELDDKELAEWNFKRDWLEKHADLWEKVKAKKQAYEQDVNDKTLQHMIIRSQNPRPRRARHPHGKHMQGGRGGKRHGPNGRGGKRGGRRGGRRGG